MTSEEDLLQEDIIGGGETNHASGRPYHPSSGPQPPHPYVSYAPFLERRRRPRMLEMIAVRLRAPIRGGPKTCADSLDGRT